MDKRIVTGHQVEDYLAYLTNEERAQATREKYLRDIRAFLAFLPGEKEVSKEMALRYKQHLIQRYKASSVNSMLAAVNNFFSFLGWHDCRVKALKIQRQMFAETDRELTRTEYTRLCHAAEQNKNQRLSLVMQTICATGIRVSELKWITAEAVGAGHTNVMCKGKRRVVFLPRTLCKQLRRYLTAQAITSGPIFLTRTGQPLSRIQVWADMKQLCQSANVGSHKVFPHNLRHLFARTLYSVEKDLGRLADILGHSSVDTTRIYTKETGLEHRRMIERLQLVLQT